MIVQSPDISIFDFQVTYDLSLVNQPNVILRSKSSGPNLSAMDYWFKATSPSGIVYHMGNEGTPDIGDGANFLFDEEYTLAEQMPTIMGHIDWSGGDWEIIGYAKDSEGNIFETPPIRTRICRPNGNKSTQKDSFGRTWAKAFMNCNTAKLLVEDGGNYSYQGNKGLLVSKKIKLFFPPDETGELPEPFEQINANSVQIEINYSGSNYQLFVESTYKYDMGNNTFVIIKYKFKACFSINCGKDFCKIHCAILKYESQLEKDGCSAADREKLLLVLSKLTRALIGIMQPSCNISVPNILSEVKKLIGDCGECEEEGSGINASGNCAVPVEFQVEIGSEPEEGGD